MDWGLKDRADKVPLIVVLPLTVKPLLTVRFSWMVALFKTLRLANSVLPVETDKDWVFKRPSEIKPERVWIVLAVWRVEGSLRVK